MRKFFLEQNHRPFFAFNIELISQQKFTSYFAFSLDLRIVFRTCRRHLVSVVGVAAAKTRKLVKFSC